MNSCPVVVIGRSAPTNVSETRSCQLHTGSNNGTCISLALNSCVRNAVSLGDPVMSRLRSNESRCLGRLGNVNARLLMYSNPYVIRTFSQFMRTGLWAIFW